METQQALTPRKTFLAGVIYFDRRQQTVNCIIRELSAEGSTLVCQDASAIPTNMIELYIPSQNEFLPAEVKERNNSELRIAFKQSQNTEPAEGGIAEVFRRLRHLEAEVKQLRRTVDELKDTRARVENLAI